MAESFDRKGTIPKDLDSVYYELVTARDPMYMKDWQVLFSNKSEDQAEVLFLSGMFSGAGFLGLWQQGARKSLVFVKLYREGKETKVHSIAGGTETWTGFDFGRHKNNVNTVFEYLER